jgi:hypothetical protein
MAQYCTFLDQQLERGGAVPLRWPTLGLGARVAQSGGATQGRARHATVMREAVPLENPFKRPNVHETDSTKSLPR